MLADQIYLHSDVAPLGWTEFLNGSCILDGDEHLSLVMVFETNSTGLLAGRTISWEIGFVRRSTSNANDASSSGWRYKSMWLSFGYLNLPVKTMEWRDAESEKHHNGVSSVTITFTSPQEHYRNVITVVNLRLAPYVEEGRECTPKGMNVLQLMAHMAQYGY